MQVLLAGRRFLKRDTCVCTDDVWAGTGELTCDVSGASGKFLDTIHVDWQHGCMVCLIQPGLNGLVEEDKRMRFVEDIIGAVALDADWLFLWGGTF